MVALARVVVDHVEHHADVSFNEKLFTMFLNSMCCSLVTGAGVLGVRREKI